MPVPRLSYNKIMGHRSFRLEAISDGVFAIALTLLVLDIKVPLAEGIHSEQELIAAFCKLSPKILAYFLSFLTIGIFWGGHSAQYHFIAKQDRNLNWLNLFFLLFVSILPFTTAFLSEFIAFRTALLLYWLNILMLGTGLYLHWRYALKRNLLNEELPPETVAAADFAIKRRIVIAQSLYFFGAALCLFSTYLSIAVIIAIQLNYALAPFPERNK